MKKALALIISTGILFLMGAFAQITQPVLSPIQSAPPTRALPPRPAAVIKSAVTFRARPFDLADVRLLDSPFKEALETDKAYLLRLDPDRFLAWFRREAGLPMKGKVYGGWESMGVAGEALGHYLSACSEMYRATGDPQLLARVGNIVDQLAECQKANGGGYVAATPCGKKAYAEIASGNIRPDGGFTLNGVWVPWYSMHKVMAGLFDAYDLCGNATARNVLIGLTDWCDREVRTLNESQMQSMLSVEHGGMAEVLANVYAYTGEPRYLALAERFRHNAIFQPVASGTDVLTGVHANANIPKFVGYERIFELTGSSQWNAAARNFWTFVSRDRSFVNGGNAVDERFNAIDNFESAVNRPAGPETCGTYNILKLTRHLYALDADSSEMDFYERGLYNHILSTQHPVTGGFVYYTCLIPGGYRTYSKDFDDFWCCVGTGMENHALYGAEIYSHRDDRLFVNLFIPSTLAWREQGVNVTQQTAFPSEPRTRLILNLTEPKTLTIAVRYPAWIAPGALKLAVNGAQVAVTARPGQYAEVTRQWNDGDSLMVDLPMRITTEPLPHDANYAAILYGPILLGGKLGRQGLTDADFRTGNPSMTKRPAIDVVPAIVVPVADLPAHLTPIPGEPLAFQTRDLVKPGDVTLIPLYQIHDERYAIYWRLSSLAGWEEDQRRWIAGGKHERELDQGTIDRVRPGEQQPEVDHQYAGEKSTTGNHEDRAWRDAFAGGWFSYRLKVGTQDPVRLLCTYWGSDSGPRQFDILIDGTRIATEQLTAQKPGEFIERSYPIPPALSSNKDFVTVKFQAKPNQMAGGLFDLRLMK